VYQLVLADYNPLRNHGGPSVESTMPPGIIEISRIEPGDSLAPPRGFEPLTNGLLQWRFFFNSFSLSYELSPLLYH
jgi:hypothetical protein